MSGSVTSAATTPIPPSEKIPLPVNDVTAASQPIRRPSSSPIIEGADTSPMEALIDEGKLDGLAAVVERHWPEAIAMSDIGDPALIEHIRSARKALLDHLQLSDLLTINHSL